MIDYEAISDGLSTDAVIELMKQLGADRYRETDKYVIFPTICHNVDASEASMKLYFYKDTKLFVCYTACETMTIFKFLKHYYDARQIAYDWYEDIYKVILNCSSFKDQNLRTSTAYKPVRENFQSSMARALPTYSQGVLECFETIYPAQWESEGISKETMKKYGIRFSISQNKIIIPHFNANGELVGIRGRALDPEEVELFGKYMPIKIENTWYSHPLSLNLYGLNYNKDNIRRQGICYIVESEKSVMQAESFTIPNCCVAICGSNFNKFALKILMKEASPREIVLCLDNEELPGQDKYFNKLYAIGEKYKNYCNFSFIYDRWNLTKPKDSPTDCGQAIFETLLRRRVRVR